ncbi:MAG: TRAP transporter substrate-binding protein DctP [Alphaproteobacteria bacterium]
MSKIVLGIGAVAATAALAISPASARDSLNAVTSLQQTNTIARSFLTTFVAPVNAAKGPISINYVGGQEVVPPRKASNALKRGQFDVLCSPTAYYIGTVPEGYALLAANQGPASLRKNGAWEVLEEVYAKKAGAHLLAWGENMTSYNMYLAKKPKMKNGIPDLSGMKMRATGTYRPLFRALGGSTINIKSSEIFTAMQRGTVEGFGFTDVSFVPLGFHQVAKYRVTPNFYQTNQVVTVNLGVWKSLTKAQQDFLTAQAIKYETTSVKWVETQRIAEEKQIKAAGVVDIALKGDAAAKYLDIAHQEIWKELKKRSEYHDKLKPMMYIPGKPSRQVDLMSATKRLKQ